MKIEYKCAICNEQFNSIVNLTNHIIYFHKLNKNNYYDKYFRKPGEGICPICGEKTLLKNVIEGYRKYCSMSCRNKDNEFINKCKNTLEHKLGKNYKKIISNKRKSTNLFIHGNENYNNREKAKLTCMDKLGVDNPSKSNKIKHKKEETCMKHFGVKYTLQSEKLKNKFKNTCIEKFGVDNPSKNELIKEQKIKTTLKHYNVKFPMQSNEVKEKYENTCIEKYGVRNVSQVLEIHKKQMFGKYKAPNGKTYDSSWEYKFELYLIEHKINYEYQSSTTFKWIDYNGKERTYIPDFKLITENGEQLIEIKGDYFFDKEGKFFDPYDKTEIGYYNAEQKYNCMINNGVKILISSDLVKLGIKI